MKIYVKAADNLEQMAQVIVSRLSVDGVKKVDIIKIRHDYATVKLIYEDGSISEPFWVRYSNNPTRGDAATQWNPEWSIRKDGAVLDENKSVVGWFKLTKNKPKTTTPNYQEDSLIVDYGTRKIELTDSSGDRVAKIVKSVK